MEIPKYIREHIEANNRLLRQANKHVEVVLDWYEKQVNKLSKELSVIPYDEFDEIKNNWFSNGELDLSAIIRNIELLEGQSNTMA